MKIFQLLISPPEGPSTLWQLFWRSKEASHGILEYTAQNFLLLQNNSLNRISQGKSQPFWSFSESGTCYNRLQMQEPHWFPIHFPKWKLEGLFLINIPYKRSWVQVYLFFPSSVVCFNIWKSSYFFSPKVSPFWFHLSTPSEAGSCLLLAQHN